MFATTSTSTQETVELGTVLARLLRADDVVLLSGDLGAGKTQFAKGVARGLGVDAEVTSPTFNILLEYVGDELPLLHFDLYRLNDAAELEDVDFFGVLESGGVSLVEWGDKFDGAVPDEYLDVRILVAADERRMLQVAGHGARGQQLAGQFQEALAR